MESKYLTMFSDVPAKQVQWLWKPYIPIGKVTLLQGDPNDGKSTMMMNIVSELSKGGAMPDGTALGRPQRIIYQCSEDDASDTIKPRLEACGADCRNVAFINESIHGDLTIDDERLRESIIDFRPRLVVIDPIQAYVENDSDLMSASKARRLMKRTGIWASQYDCAIVVIGHMNKYTGSKDLYRGLGSIDLVASARSVLQVERDSKDPAIRTVHHVKSSAVPSGPDFTFEIRPETGFRWLSFEKAKAPVKTINTEEPILDLPKNKHELATILINKALKDGPVPSTEIKKIMEGYRIGDKTLNEVRMALGIKPYRKMRVWYYIIIGMGFLIVSLFLSFSKYGNIVLGAQNEKPKYNFFTWGSMMFTCGLAADILFYSFAEWTMYATNPHIAEMEGGIFEWAGVFPLFHWSFIPWSFYLVLAVAFGFMLHCRKRDKQRYSEACMPVIGEKHAHGLLGRVIDLFALFALLAGTATTFSVATPLMAEIIVTLFGISISRTVVTIIILLITCAVYTYAVLHGFKGISFLAKLCIYLFFGLQILVLLIGGQGRFIIENGVQSLGKLFQNFIGLSTYMDPVRSNNFPQDWTIYYWAYWMVWCICAPFFIGNISRGRTIKQVVLGGYIFGVGSTISSFVILGNYGLGAQIAGKGDFIAQYAESGDLYSLIINIVKTMPAAPLILIITMLCMILFYATSFDSIAYTAACYSYKSLGENEKPHTMITLLWCLLLIVLPIALVFSESSMNNIQSVSIISAFPIGIIMILMIWSFFKDAKKYRIEKGLDKD